MRKIHLILSLAAGFWLAASGISGSLLVFGDELDQALHPSLFVVRADGNVAIDDVLAAAERATSGRATRVRLAGRNTPVHEVWIDCDDCRRAFVDPSTARVNGVRSAHGTTRTFLHELHRRLLFRGPGDWIALTGGVALIALSLTGIWLGWRGGLRVRRASFYELHRVIGLIAAPLLLIAGGTGIYFIQATLRAKPASPSTARPLAIERELHGAARAIENAEPTWINLAEPVTVRLRRDGEPHPNGTTFVQMQRGAVLRVTEKPNRVYPLHIGTFGGIVHRWLMVLAGLTPAFLMITGVVLWLRRTRRARAREARRVELQQCTT